VVTSVRDAVALILTNWWQLGSALGHLLFLSQNMKNVCRLGEGVEANEVV
jgi:hypothetical protein